MKTEIFCLREFDGLLEVEQAGYLIFCGDQLTINTAIFPDLTYNGTAVTGHAMTLFGFYSRRNKSELAMKNYTDELDVCKKIMDVVYNEVEVVANGNGAIVAKAGVNGTSTNTARLKRPSIASHLKYLYAELAGEMLISYKADKLAHGAVIVTFADPRVTVKVSATHQLTITIDDVEVLVDISTTIKTTIKNLKALLR
jgi:hypothetical protein